MEERPFENWWEVSQLDQKLLWAELDEEQSGAEAWLKEALKHQNWKWNERDEKGEISWTLAIFLLVANWRIGNEVTFYNFVLTAA